MPEPRVHRYKTILMQRLLDAVAQGYRYYTSGRIPAARARRLVEKFAERYGTDRNANQRAHARRRGRANVRLLLYAPPGARVLHWWLLATPGEGAIHEQEQLRDAHDRHQRLRLDDDYELVRHTDRHTGRCPWTWRMTRNCMRRWHERIHQAATRRGSTMLMRQTLQSLARTPGFSGVRSQVWHLAHEAERKWKRFHRKGTPMPEMPKHGYVERLRDETLSLSEWVASNQAFETDDPEG